MIATSSRTEEERELSTTAKRFCRKFSLAEIKLATTDFSDAHLIGMGGFGKVYKGLIDNGQLIVAIKRLESNSNQGAHEFLMEIETLSKVRHVNLVSLIGYCNENEEMILVYEYIVYGTLADHLYKLSRNNTSEGWPSLTWQQRLKICIGAGRGLDYLHTGCSIIHRDVKSTNILLDENFTAKVSDFGLAKHLSSVNSQGHVSTMVKGSFGYLDPSYFITCRLTRKSDTYAFGVVLLEVLCGRPAVDPRLGEDEMSLVMWAQEKISKGKVDQIVASNLKDEISKDCLKAFVGVARKCLRSEPEKRPTMGEVVVGLLLALKQQRRQVPTHNASRFPLLDALWNRGNHATGSAQKDYNQADANTLSTGVPPTKEDAFIEKLIGNIPFIPFDELKEITGNFSSKNLIGRGSNGSVFYGFLKSGEAAAIKELNHENRPDSEFLAQVTVSSGLNHENFVRLLGYCVGGGLQFLACEFAPNGSLNDILHRQQGSKGLKPGPALSWAQRVKIAVGAARGLKYIHKKGQVHGNIKSSNILVFNDGVAKIADLGEPIQSPVEDIDDLYLDFHPSVFRRPRGHHPPEYVWSGELSWRTDVYSFGVVLLELLTGRKLLDRKRPIEQEHLVMWAAPWLGSDAINEVVDARLNRNYPPKAVVQMAEIAGLCLQDKYDSRPNMATVVRSLALLPSLADVPNLSCN